MRGRSTHGIRIHLPGAIKHALPGMLLSAVIALAVSFISQSLGGPAMLYALLFGMAFNFLNDDSRFATGIRIASRNVLRVGVAILGFRITAADVMSLGWPVVGLVGACIATTMLVGWAIGRAFGLRSDHAVLSAGAVAICGASAALAIASILPSHKHHERNTILTVATVTALSTIAMVIYPVFVTYLALDDRTVGVFLGATIHDVAQVVGAGYMVSVESGEISTLVKLMRVAFLVPVVLLLSVIMHDRKTPRQGGQPLIPWFLVTFVGFVLINSMGWVPERVQDIAAPASSWCLLTAIAALGVKTSLKSLAEVGPAPVGVMVLQTLFLAVSALVGIWLFI